MIHPCIRSVWYGNEKTVELFLSCPHIQDKNPKDDRGNTPMHLAARKGDVKTVELFLKCDQIQDKSPTNVYWETPLDMAKRHFQMEKEKKAEEQLQSKDTIVKNHQQVVELLQKYECNTPSISKSKLMKKKYSKSKAF